MDMVLLKAFVVLSQAGSYHEAAKRLFITQSALTKKINKLEDLLDLHLFDRGRNGAQLTPSGRFLLPHAKALLKQADLFKNISKEAKNGNDGHLYIGFGLSTLKIAPAMISQFRQQYPKVLITLNDIGSEDQIRELTSGELSIGFLRLPVPKPLKQQVLLSDRLVLVVNKTIHRGLAVEQVLAQSHFLRLSDKRGPGLNMQVSQYLKFNRYEMMHEIEYSDEIQTLLGLVSAGIGVSILPQSAVLLGVDNIEILPLQGKYVEWQVGMVWYPMIEDPVRDNFITCFVE